MSLGFQARASKRVLAKFGKDALLRGAPAGKVAVFSDLENAPGRLDDANDNHVSSVKMAIIGSEYNPKVGDTLDHPDGMFVLDRKIEDTGYVRHFTVIAV